MAIIEYINCGRENAITRRELSQLTGLDDRTVREQIEQLKANVPIINLQNGEGYFIPTEDDFMDAKRYVRQEEARIRALQKALRPVKEMVGELECQIG